MFQDFILYVNNLDTSFRTCYRCLVTDRKLSLNGLTSVALALVDRSGFAALNLSAVASDLEVGPSALYTHVSGLTGLRHLVAVASIRGLTEQVRDAAIGVSGHGALTAIGHAYRSFALEYPGRFASTLLPPLGDEQQLAETNESLLGVFIMVYGAMGLPSEASYMAARCCRSAIHGFLALENVTGTGPTHDAEYDHMLDALARGLAPDL